MAKKNNRLRYVKIALIALACCAAALVLWVYLAPIVTSGSVTLYSDYTTAAGDVATNMSFNAILAVQNAETLQAGEFTTVRKVFVTQSQQVTKNEKIVQLANGDVLRANFDGVVNDLRVAQGDWLRRGAQIAQICDFSHLEVTMRVDEYDIEKVSVGQACTITVLPLGMSFDSTIHHINRVSASAGAVAYYTATAQITVPDNVLPGMQATVSIPSEKAEGVVTLSIAAISFDEQGQPYVLIKNEKGEYERRAVETGLSDGKTVEIKSGLQAGQTVSVITGTQSTQSGLTLSSLYRSIVGTTEVINDKSASDRGGRRNNRDGTASGASSGGQDAAEGLSSMGGAPEQGATPEQAAPPEQAVSPKQTAAPEHIASPEQTATPEQAVPPTQTAAPEKGERHASDERSAPTVQPAATAAPDQEEQPNE